MPTLFDPVEMGAIACPNRIVMAPLTRGRADRAGVPTAMMADYYAQRASAGLIISEGTGISREGLGWPYAPGLWTEAQVEGWKPVVAAVHAAGGRIVAQLWHMGRMVHSAVTGAAPLSASATTAPGEAHSYEGKRAFEVAEAMGTDAIARTLDDYARAAANARRAGFDGVQIHGANGYLVDQFLRATTNHRGDTYGGPVENRLRFLGEVIDATISGAGRERTGLRLSPNGAVNGCDDPDHITLFAAAAALCEQRGLPWLELREPTAQSSFRPAEAEPASPAMRRYYSGVLVLNSDYRGPSASAALAERRADAISFGRPYISNPDLVARLAGDLPLARWDVASFYTQGRAGYTDYPSVAEQPAV